jgi:hypothetical protein
VDKKKAQSSLAALLDLFRWSHTDHRLLSFFFNKNQSFSIEWAYPYPVFC